MNPRLFENSSSGRVLQVGAGEIAYWAYLPNALPPDLTFDTDLVQRLSAADRALGGLAGLGRTIANPHLLIRPFVRKEAVLSSRIEGTQADLADLYAYEAGQLMLPGFQPAAADSDVREVHNYVLALEYGVERLQTLPVSLRLLRELHERLMAGVRGEQATPGEFRRSQNWIGPPGSTLNEATYVPPPVEEMQTALYAFESYLHQESTYPPLIQLGFIHYQFEAIHPFLDGNGRIGRLLMVLLMIDWSLLPLPLLYLSAYFHRHRETYYDLLLAVSADGAWREWLLFFLQGITEQADDAGQRARSLQDLQHAWDERLQADRATGLMHRVMNLLFERPILAANDIAERFEVTHPTAMQTLRRLESMDIVKEITGQQRNKRYIASEILAILQ